jgi:hypothetical protein
MKKGTFNNKKNRQCKYCLKEFSEITGSEFANHVRWCKLNPNLDMVKEKENSKKAIERSNFLQHGKLCYYAVSCYHCKSFFIVLEREKSHSRKKRYFCSRSCGTSYSASCVDFKSDSFSNAVSSGVKKKWNDDPEYSKKVLSNHQYFTSKGERDIRDWFIKSFPDEEWTFGGALKYESITGIVRDLYSNKLKVCIEYDGIWHFKDIYGQLRSKQIKDTALENWCLENHYRLIRIKEEIYQSDPSFWKEKLHQEVLNGKESIKKFY